MPRFTMDNIVNDYFKKECVVLGVGLEGEYTHVLVKMVGFIYHIARQDIMECRGGFLHLM